MIRLAANLTTTFGEVPFRERFAQAAAAGFTGVECVSPYGEPPEVVAEELHRHGLTMALFNMPPGDWAAGERGFGADPARTVEFRESIETALTYAKATRCETLHLMAGKMPADGDRAAWRDTLVANTRIAADRLGEHGITIVLEAINTKVDIPTYFYDRTRTVLGVIADVDRANVKLLFDIYHMQIMEGDIARTIAANLPAIGHVQIADNPGRHEPGTGEINFDFLLNDIDLRGYAGWIGCEYIPLGTTAAGLGWTEPYLARKRSFG